MRINSLSLDVVECRCWSHLIVIRLFVHSTKDDDLGHTKILSFVRHCFYAHSFTSDSFSRRNKSKTMKINEKIIEFETI